MAADFCCRTVVEGVRLAPSSVWCRAARRIRAVVAMEMPIDPPMLRSMLKRPVALPISLSGDGGHGHGGHGHKDEAERKAGEGDGNEQRVGADVEVDGAEDERADAEAEEAGAEQLAVVDAGAEEADDRRADERADAARADDQAGGEGGVAENLLVVEGQDGDGDVDAHAEHGDQEAAGAEVAVLEDVQVDQALGMGPGVPDPERRAQTTSAATAQRTQTAPNQSSSWPLSSTICRQPVQTMSRPKPMLSKGPTLAFLM